MRLTTTLLLGASLLALGGCASTIIQSTADVAVAVAKVPYKVGRAVVDATTEDD